MTALLVFVHLRIGAIDQIVDRGRRVGVVARDPDAGGQDIATTAIRVEADQRGLQPLDNAVGAERRAFGNQSDEFVAADATDHIGIAEGVAHQAGHILDRLVALGVAELIVDRLEAVEIDENREHRAFFAGRALELLLGESEKTTPVAQTGEFVAHRHPHQFVAHLNPFGHIHADAHDIADPPIRVAHRGRVPFEGQRPAVLVVDHHFVGDQVLVAQQVARRVELARLSIRRQHRPPVLTQQVVGFKAGDIADRLVDENRLAIG